MKNADKSNSFPPLISSMELNGFREKTDQLISNLENNDITSALECINEINEINGKNFYSIIGKLTRGLHDAIADLSDSSSSTQDRQENDKTRVDLSYVISLTDGAAKKTLDMTEQSKDKIRKLGENRAAQSALLEEYLASHTPDEKTSQLLQDLSSLFQENGENIAQVDSNVSEIIMAQNFQDIASQSITKAIHIIKEVENSLVALTQYANLLTKLSQFSEEDPENINVESSEELKSDIGQLNNINESEHLDQGDVDDLLSSLGF